MRSRHSLAILTMMGVSPARSTATAVRLARDRAWYAQIRANLAANKHPVYRDGACIAALARPRKHSARGLLKFAVDPR
jgi:hypothetical protein